MDTARTSFSCIVLSNNKLYAVGGSAILTIKFIYTIDIHSNSLQYRSSSLSSDETFDAGLQETTCAEQDDSVHILGGTYPKTTRVHRISTTTNSVEARSINYLDTAVSRTGSIMEDGIIYGSFFFYR